MAKNVNTPETDVIVNAKGKLELLFEKYGKILLIVLGVIGVAVGGYFIYKNYADKKEEERIAKSEIAMSNAVASNSTEDAVNMAENKEFEGTAANNFANYLAAARLLQEGDLDAAESYIAKYADIEDTYIGEMINAAACAIRGDIAVERGNYDEAIAQFNNAIEMSDDMYTFVTMKEKLGRLYIKMGKRDEAVKCYKAIVEEYPDMEQAYAKFIW